MTTVKLHGKLGETVGEIWKLAVSSVSEAVRAIEGNTGTLYEYLTLNNQQVEYRILINGVDHTETTELQIPRSKLEQIDIIPVPAGSSSGLWQTIIGVVLIIVAVVFMFVPGLQPVAGSLGAYAVGLLFSVGASLMLGGIAQMMSKSPQLGLGSDDRRIEDDTLKTEDKTKSSYLFGGVINTTSQGNCVPLGYGRMMCGSQLIGFGLFDAKIPADAEFGDMTPGDQVDPFDQQPVLVYIHNSFFFAPHRLSIREFNNRNTTKTEALYRKFFLDTANPKLPGLKNMREMLETVYWVFHNNRNAHINKKEAYRIYKHLALPGYGTDTVQVHVRNAQGTSQSSTFKTYKEATSEEVIMELAWFYYFQIQPTEGNSL